MQSFAFFFLWCLVVPGSLVAATKPNILYILADDLGWNDVSWHDPDMYSPIIQGLAFENSVILNQSYVTQLCSQTRSALLTGYYPYHIGTQNGVFKALEPSGVPTSFKFFPEDLKAMGYKNYMVGKWHLGFCKKEYLPTNRGFDKYFGYYNGAEDYNTHKVRDGKEEGLDFWEHVSGDADQAQWGYDGSYSAEVFSKQTQNLLDDHDSSKPFFLYLAFQSVHEPLQVPDKYRDVCKQTREDRNVYCGMVNAMDQAIGEVVDKLKSLALYDNTIIIFSNDNGGQTIAGGNNWPLRGNKDTLWEGGCRSVTFVHSPKYLNGVKRTSEDLFHVVDWYPTLLQMANDSENIQVVNHGDGLGQWEMIKTGKNTNPRDTMVYNIDSYDNMYAIRQGKYKYIKGHPGIINDWVPPTRSGVPNPRLRGEWLFDLDDDPTEHNNLNTSQPDILKTMQTLLQKLEQTAVPTVHTNDDDPAGDPKNFNNTWNTGWCS